MEQELVISAAEDDVEETSFERVKVALDCASYAAHAATDTEAAPEAAPEATPEAAPEAVPEAGGAPSLSAEDQRANELTAEEIQNVQDRARELASKMTPDDVEGLRDLQNLTLAMALPAVREIFKQMIAKARLGNESAAEAYKEVEAFSPITEFGCMRVDFHNKTTNRPDIAYLSLKKCKADYNFDQEINKLRKLVAEDKWPNVLTHLSMLVYIGRSVYGQISRLHAPLLRRIFRLPAADPCTNYIDLKVDGVNTTLYVDKNDTWRIGIFIQLDNEIKKRK